MTFQITVKAEMLSVESMKLVPMTFTGSFDCSCREKAINEAKEYYAYEFDTTEDEIEIVEVQEEVDEVKEREELIKRDQRFISFPSPDYSKMTNEQLRQRVQMLEDSRGDIL